MCANGHMCQLASLFAVADAGIVIGRRRLTTWIFTLFLFLKFFLFIFSVEEFNQKSVFKKWVRARANANRFCVSVKSVNVGITHGAIRLSRTTRQYIYEYVKL